MCLLRWFSIYTHTHTLFKNTQQTCMNKMQITITKENYFSTSKWLARKTPLRTPIDSRKLSPQRPGRRALLCLRLFHCVFATPTLYRLICDTLWITIEYPCNCIEDVHKLSTDNAYFRYIDDQACGLLDLWRACMAWAPARGEQGGQAPTLEKIRVGMAHPGNFSRGPKTSWQ